MSHRIIFAGGGSAGHVEPALAVAREWISSHPDDKALFLGTKNGLENQLVPAAGFDLHIITRVSIARRLNFELLSIPSALFKAVKESISAMRKADLLIGFGGYVSGPAYLAARILGVPVVIHEANAKPGIANRFGSLFTRNLAVATPVDSGAFSGALITGLPLREDVHMALISSDGQWLSAREDAKRKLGLDPTKRTIFIFGGSQGSVVINRVLAASLTAIIARDIQVFHGVGKAHQLPEPMSGYFPVHYITEMATAYLAADLIIARSGAVTCSEVRALGKFALFIPLPIGNGEQKPNALSLVRDGRAEIIDQDLFTPQWLDLNIERLLKASQARDPKGYRSDFDASKKIVALMESAL